MPIVTKSELGKVSVPEIATMSDEAIDAEIDSYSGDDLLNRDTLLRLGDLRIASKSFAQVRFEAKERLAARFAERAQRRLLQVA